MNRINFNFKLCFGLAVVSLVLCFLYISSFKDFAKLATEQPSATVKRPEGGQNAEQRAIDILRATVGTIPNFTPKQSTGCPKFPDIYNLRIDGDVWQVLETTNGTFYLFGAYYDDREKNVRGPSVRIVGMANRLDPVVPTICQLWYEDRQPVEVPVSDYKLIWLRAWGVFRSPSRLYPYLITCEVPEAVRTFAPDAVSLVEGPCDPATNNLAVHDNYVAPDQQKDFVVCVKGVDFPFDDLSVRLVEWIELLRLFGVAKVVFYNLDSHPNVNKVLDFYEANGGGFVEVRPMTLPGRQLDFGHLAHYYLRRRVVDKRFAELIAYNDCLYRHLHEFRYVAPMDIDEVIVPTLDRTYQQLVRRVHLRTANGTYSALAAQNVYFLGALQRDRTARPGSVPREMRMLRHVVRTRNFTRLNYFAKSFQATAEAVAVHNHFPLHCFTARGNYTCRSYAIGSEMAQLNHYRDDCRQIGGLAGKKCDELKRDSVVDGTLWRFEAELVPRVLRVAAQLGLTLTID